MKKIFTILFSAIFSGLIAQCPDLKITHASVLELKHNSIRYALNVTNIGNISTRLDGITSSESDNVIIHSYLSSDESIDLLDKKVQTVILGLASLETINPGEVFSIVNRDSISTSGYRYLIMKIDPTNIINECAELNNVYILELRSSPLTLEAPKIEGIKGSNIEIPIYASNFFNILGFQFSISFPKSAILRIDSIGNLGLNEWIRNDIRIKNNNTIGVVWFSPYPEGVSFNDKKRLFTVYATLTGEHGDCTDIRFDDSFLPLEFISTSPLSEPVNVETIPGQLCIQNHVECTGRITLSTQLPIPNVKVKGNHPRGFETTTTDYNGKYIFTQLTPGFDYIISAEKSDSYSNGLSVMDILFIKKHLLEIQLLPTPYEIIAADVNGDLTISVQDIILIRNLILGVIPHFGKTPVWQFIPKSYKFKNPLNPLNEDYPISYSLPNLKSNKASIDFIGIKTGDVSLDWREGGANQLETRAASFFTLTLNEQLLEANREYILPVYTRQFNNIAAFQFALNFDPGITFQKLTTPSITDFNEQNYRVNNNQLNVLWYDSRATGGRFITDTGTLFLIHFRTSKSIDTRSLFTMDYKRINPEAIHAQNRYYTIKMETLKAPPVYKIKEDVNVMELHLFPNPVTDVLNVRFNMEKSGQAILRVVDLAGRSILQQSSTLNKGEQNIQLHTRTWPEGRYSVSISTETHNQTKGVVCNH